MGGPQDDPPVTVRDAERCSLVRLVDGYGTGASWRRPGESRVERSRRVVSSFSTEPARCGRLLSA